MIRTSPNQNRAEPRKFVPEVKPLESRLLLSQSLGVSFPDGSSIFVPLFPRLPRTGGEFTQTGSVLNIGVGQSTTNTVHVAHEGHGGVTAQWNGGPSHVLTGVDTTVIQMRRARNNQVTILAGSGGDTFTARVAAAGNTFKQPGPSTGSTGIDLSPPGPARSVGGDAAPAATGIRRTSGSAVQSGSVLTVTVTKPGSNTVEISNEGGGAILVEWNGGTVHSFMGIDTIVVDTHNARNNVVGLHDIIR